MRLSLLLACWLVVGPAGLRAQVEATTSPQSAVLLADSVRGFSHEQGANGWFYGFWDQSADGDGAYDPTRDFRRLPNFGDDAINGLSRHDDFTTGELWYLEDGRFYTSLWAEGGHAHGEMDLGGYARAAHWVVRRWVSAVDSEVEIAGRAGKTMPWGENWSGDVVFRVVVGGSTVYEATLDGGSQPYSVTTSVEDGTTVDFLIGPGSAIGVVDFTGAIRRKADEL